MFELNEEASNGIEKLEPTKIPSSSHERANKVLILEKLKIQLIRY